MKYKSVFILFLLIFSVAFGGVSKPPAAVASIYKVNSNLTPIYTFRNDLTGGKISFGLLSNSLLQLNNQVIGNVAQLTSSQADDTYLRLDGLYPMTSDLDLGGNNLIGDGDTYLDFGSTADQLDIYIGSVLALSLNEAAGVITNTSAGPILFPDGSVTLPAIAFSGKVDMGIYRLATSIRFTVSGVEKVRVGSASVQFGPSGGTSPAVAIAESTATVAVFNPIADTGSISGLGGIINKPAMIANSVTIQEYWESSGVAIVTSHGLFDDGVTAGITASTTQTQGQQPLVTTVNEISTVANANDTVTMPTAVGGRRIIIINNGANTLQIFPASGDDLGAGVDTAITLVAASNLHLVAYDDVNWEQL